MGGIDKDDIGAGLDERLHSRLPVWTGTHRGTNPQPPHPVLARVRILFPLLYILDGYEPLEIAPPVNHRELLDPVAVENLLRLLDGCAGRDRNHLPCHDLGDLLGEVIFKLQIPVGENPYELPTSYNRQPRYVPLLLDPNGVRKALIGAEGQRFKNDTALKLLHLCHLGSLLIHREVLVYHAEPPLLRQRYSHPGFSHCIHCRAEDGDLEGNRTGKACRYVDIPGVNTRKGGCEEHIIKGEPLSYILFCHKNYSSRLITTPSHDSSTCRGVYPPAGRCRLRSSRRT